MDHILRDEDAELERRLKYKAIETALLDMTHGRPHAEIRLEIIRKIAELDEKIARKLAE